MNAQTSYPVSSTKRGIKLVHAILQGAGAGNLVVVNPNGFAADVLTATRSSAGTFALTFRHKHIRLLDSWLGHQGVTAGLSPRFSAIDVTLGTATLITESFSGVATAWQTAVTVTAHAATLANAGLVTSVAATTQTGLFPAWSGATAVSGDTTAEIATAGYITAVTVVAGNVTGACNLRYDAAATSRDARVVYSAAGLPTISFLAGDAVTSVRYQQSRKGELQAAKEIIHTGTPGAGQVKVEYTAGVPTLTFNTADNVTVAAVGQQVGGAAGLKDPASTDYIHVTLVVSDSSGA